MAHGFDTGAAIKATIEKILQLERLPITLCTDSKSLYDCLVKLGTTQEKRLMVDLMCLRQSYERREIAEIKWIDGGSNPADAMTKSRPCQALKDLIDTNTVKLQVTEWVERTGDKEGSISDLINRDISRTSGTLPSRDRNLRQSTAICHSLPAPRQPGQKTAGSSLSQKLNTPSV